MDCFLYDRDLRHERVKTEQNAPGSKKNTKISNKTFNHLPGYN